MKCGIPVLPERGKHIEQPAAATLFTANQLAIELATMEAPDRREWPKIEAEVHYVHHARHHTGHGEGWTPGRKIEEIGRAVSEVARRSGIALASRPGGNGKYRLP